MRAMQSAVSMAPLIPSTPARTITVVATAVAAIFCLSSALSVHCHQHPVPAVATQSDFTTFFTPSSLLNDSSDGNVAGRDFVGSVDGHVSPPSVRGRRSPTPTGKGGSGDIRKSAFVCQDGTLRLSCTAGKHIDVLRANFGRFSITLCNPSGTLDWSVNCASGNSLSVLTQRCSGRVDCAVEASSSIFGPDPCPMTSKYLEVHYRCISGAPPPSSESSEQAIDSNRSATAVADNDNALWSNSGARTPGEELISPENSLSGQVLTPTQSSMGESAVLAEQDNWAAAASAAPPPTHGLNQDLLSTSNYSNYLNVECNQPDSESSSSSSGNQFASAKCKQMDALDSANKKQEAKTRQPVLFNQSPSSSAESSSRDRWPHQVQTTILPALWHDDDNKNKNNINNNDNDKENNQSEDDQTARLHHHSPQETVVLSASGEVVQQQWPSTISSSFDGGFASMCSAVKHRGIDWPPTVAGSLAIRPCPQDASGLAQWQCTDSPAEADGQLALWSNLPDLSRCHSRWLLELHSFQNVNNFRNDIWKSILTTLHQSTLFGADLVELNSLLHTSLQSIFDTIAFTLNSSSGSNQAGSVNFESVHQQQQQQQPSLSNLDALLETVSHLLGDDNAWLDLPALKREVTALDLLDIASKYATLICLDARHSNRDSLVKYSSNLVVSCYSASKVLLSLQLSSQPRFNVSREFKLPLQPTAQQYLLPAVSASNVTATVLLKAANLTTIINGDVHFGAIMPSNLQQYFEVNANRTTELRLEAALAKVVQLKLKKPRLFLNANLMRFLVVNGSQVVPGEYVHWYQLEIEFKHMVPSAGLWHECVHWDNHRHEWSNEQCTLLRSNETHSVCRCGSVSTCSLLAAEQQHHQQRQQHSVANKSDTGYMLTLLPYRGNGSIFTAALIAYMWIFLLLTRCHRSFFNDYNFGPMLVACIGRTVLELCILSTALWPEQTSHWCQAGLFLVLVQLQTISSMLLVFVFQNTLLAVLASKIYLSKNYATSLHAMTKTRQIQTVTAIVFAPIQLALLFSAAPSSVCWPAFGELVSTGLISVLLVISPLLQLSTVAIAGFAFLHCSQKVFSEYGYPNLHCITLQTTLFEKHVKDVSRSRRQQCALWSLATCVYLFGVLVPHTVALCSANLSISLIGLDVGLSLSFLLFARLKYVYLACAKCSGQHQHSSTPTHCSSKDLSSSSSMRDNSISILSESSKTFLTLPGQISLAKMLDSPKIYPSPHRSSSTYARNGNPSSHLYESPKHLYKYEFERHLYNGSGGSGGMTASNTLYTPSSMANGRGSLFPLRVNSRLAHCPPSMEPTSPMERFSSAYHDGDACSLDFSRPTNSMARPHPHPNPRPPPPPLPSHAFRSRFFDRDNFISLS